ncbi:hypothetical protein [Lyngbya sp. CCY1209]|uniref:hypothetical protein n=1 Tax=Lyngbya sp. CCY1209 TaxID=2886103 RepID=UPI002D1FE409|nr:hypothetical protein [Lyngbya sp. CCY1209]MEB3884391.1 hypothetical protein [Lyngbya sp. CCY1209]
MSNIIASVDESSQSVWGDSTVFHALSRTDMGDGDWGEVPTDSPDKISDRPIHQL